MNIENLKKLSSYLKGELKADFNMANYAALVYNTTCGSVGCAIGHGPYAGIPKYKEEHWIDYSFRVFNISSNDWYWCFSADWASTDNAALSAATRIDWLIEHGLPEDWHDQMIGKSQLCYK